MKTDKEYMSMAIELALRAQGRTNPNPLVGAIVVKDSRIVGKGYHKKCGTPHAEIHALRAAGQKAKGATLYVTLEPCNHFGRTPPCTDAIIASGIKKVVMAMPDPNPITNGRGIRKLNKNGMKTIVGILKEEAAAINKPFIKFVTKKMPYVRLKVAESIDGKIATRSGDSRWITADDSRRYVHELRGKVDAVMVGVGTLLKDDPLLLSKVPGSTQPIRIVVDSTLKTPTNARIFLKKDKYSVVIATTKEASFKKAELFAKNGISILFCKTKNGMVDLRDLLKKLSMLNIVDLMVEGGGELAASLIEEKLVDKFSFFIAPKIIGGRQARTPVEGSGIDKMKDAVLLKNVSVRRFTRDILIEAEAQ